jgi:ribosomal protein S16
MGEKFFFINFERLAHWLLRGAKPTYSVAALFGKFFSKVS